MNLYCFFPCTKKRKKCQVLTVKRIPGCELQHEFAGLPCTDVEVLRSAPPLPFCDTRANLHGPSKAKNSSGLCLPVLGLWLEISSPGSAQILEQTILSPCMSSLCGKDLIKKHPYKVLKDLCLQELREQGNFSFPGSISLLGAPGWATQDLCLLQGPLAL